MFRRQTWLDRCLVLDAASSWDLCGSVYPETSETVYQSCQQEMRRIKLLRCKELSKIEPKIDRGLLSGASGRLLSKY